MGAENDPIRDRLTRLNFGMSTAQAAGGTVTTHYANAAGQSMEQIYNPIQIVKGKPQGQTPTPGFEPLSGGGDESGTWGSFQHVGPTSLELDPYFSNILAGDDGTEFFAGVDYNLIVHEDSTGTTTDLNIKKIQNKRNVQKVRVNAHRAPLILSGWGFDLGDRPVPRMGPTFPEIFKFEESVGHNRASWKSGPLAVAWDDERQVWAGGPQIVCGIALEEVRAPETPCDPTYFNVQLFRKTTDELNGEITTELDDAIRDEDGEIVKTLDGGSDRIKVANRDPSLEQAYVKNAMFVIAIRLNYEWLPLWVGCPEDEIPDEDVPCIVQPEEEEEPDGGDPPTDIEPQSDPEFPTV
jgi:hypothetical protein